MGGSDGMEGSCQKGPAAPAGGQSDAGSWGDVAAVLRRFILTLLPVCSIQALLRKYVPLAVVLFFVLLVLWLRAHFYS